MKIEPSRLTTSSKHMQISRPIAAKAQQTHRTARPQTNGSTTITAEERMQMIALGAYYRAEARGFESGGEMDDWLEAEREVDSSLVFSSDSPDSV